MSEARPRKPTSAETEYLRRLGSGDRIVVAHSKREAEKFLRRGWVTAELCDAEAKRPYYAWVTITPDGLRALAAGTEEFGWPAIGPKPQRQPLVCSDCGSERRACAACGCKRYHFAYVDITEPVPGVEDDASLSRPLTPSSSATSSWSSCKPPLLGDVPKPGPLRRLPTRNPPDAS